MSNGYRLGVDLGTTFTAVGLARGGSYEMVRLGSDRIEIPSTVCAGPDGSVQVGEAAERLAELQPTAVARDVKRRIGDTVPLLLEGQPFSPQTLMARLLRWAIERARALPGAPPELITITCPANWGPYKHDLLRQVIRLAEAPPAIVCTEPEAAAIRHAGADAQRPGSLVGVYDLGGGTFDAAVLRPTNSGVFTLAGSPEGIEHLGGIDFDEALYAHVLRSLGQEALDLAESDDPDILRAMAAIRRRCVAAKETLSGDPSAEIQVNLAGRRVSVPVTRNDFEAMIRPALAETVAAFERAVRNAGSTPEALTSVILVGGSVRIPLVFETISRRLDCQVVMPRDPGHSVALGAAMAADRYRLPTRSASARTRSGRFGEQNSRPVASEPVAESQRAANLAVRELLRLHPGERARLTGWQVADGAVVKLGQPLANVQIAGAGGGRSLTLRSPFEGVLHRRFLDPGVPFEIDDLLAAFRQVTGYLYRPGRSRPDDQGLLIRINPPTSATAIASRPVILLDRAPRAVWWAASFCLLTEPGQRQVSAAYVRHNQWFGVASQTVDVVAGQLRALDYTDPGRAATAVLRPLPGVPQGQLPTSIPA